MRPTSSGIEGAVEKRSAGGSQAGAIIARGLQTSSRGAAQVGIGVFHRGLWCNGDIEIAVKPPVTARQSRGARVATTTGL